MNLIKKILFISFIFVQNFAHAQSIDLQKFNDDLNRYKPNAPWIMHQLVCMNLKDFSTGFHLAIKILADPNEKRQYFEKEDDIWPFAWWQCAVYELYLENLFWNNKTDKFFLNQDKMNLTELLKQNYEPVLSMLKDLEVEDEHPLFLFYAFYTDCLTHIFTNVVKNAYLTIENSAEFTNMYIKVLKLQKILEQKIKILGEFAILDPDKTKFQNSYQPLISRNQEIIKLLENEKSQIK